MDIIKNGGYQEIIEDFTYILKNLLIYIINQKYLENI